MNKIFKMKDKKYTPYTPTNISYHPPPSLIDGAHIGESPSTVPTHKHHRRSDSLKNLFHAEDVPSIPAPVTRADTLKQRRRSASAPQPSPIFESEFEDQQDISQVLHQTHLLDLERKYWQRLGSKPLARSSNSISRHFSNAQPLNKHSRSTSHDQKQSNHKRIASTSSNKSSLARSQSLSVPTKPLEIHLARSNSKHIHGCGKFIRKAWSFNKENHNPHDVHLRVVANSGNLHIRNQGTDSINVLSDQDKIRIENGDGGVYGQAHAQVLEPSPSTSQVGLAVTSSSPAPPESSLPVHSGSYPATPPLRPPRARSVATFTDDQIPLSQRRIVIPQRSSSKRFSPSLHQQSPSKSMIVGSEYTTPKLRRKSTGNSSSRSMSATSSRSMTYDTYLAYHRDDEKGETVFDKLADDDITNGGSLANHSIASDVATLDHHAPPLATLFLGTHDSSNTNSTSSVMEELRDAPLPPKRTGDIMQASRAPSQTSLHAPVMQVDVSHTSEILDDASDKTGKRVKGWVNYSVDVLDYYLLIAHRKEPPVLTITLPPREEAPTALQSPFKEPPQAPNNDKQFGKEIDHFLYVRDPSPAPPIPRKSPRRKSPNPSVQSSPHISAAIPINRPEGVQRVVNTAQEMNSSGHTTPESVSIRNSGRANRSRSNSAMRPSVGFVQPTGSRAESKPLLVLDVETVKNKLRVAKEARAKDDVVSKREEEAKQLAKIEAFRRSRVDRNGTYSSQRSQKSQKTHPFANTDTSNVSKNINTVGDSLSKRLSSDAYLNNLRLSSQQSPRLTRVTENEDSRKNIDNLFYKPRPVHTNAVTHVPSQPPLPAAAPRYQARPSMSSTGSNVSALSSQSGREMKPKSNIKDLEEMLRNLKMRRARNQAEREREDEGEKAQQKGTF